MGDAVIESCLVLSTSVTRSVVVSKEGNRFSLFDKSSRVVRKRTLTLLPGIKED